MIYMYNVGYYGGVYSGNNKNNVILNFHIATFWQHVDNLY